MFFIESFGFGRGLGALDLKASKFERDFKVLNFQLLSKEQKQRIINAFEPITKRNRMPLKQEIEHTDRVNFEKVLLEAFEIDEHFEAIKSALLQLYNIRFAIKSAI